MEQIKAVRKIGGEKGNNSNNNSNNNNNSKQSHLAEKKPDQTFGANLDVATFVHYGSAQSNSCAVKDFGANI